MKYIPCSTSVFFALTFVFTLPLFLSHSLRRPFSSFLSLSFIFLTLFPLPLSPFPLSLSPFPLPLSFFSFSLHFFSSTHSLSQRTHYIFPFDYLSSYVRRTHLVDPEVVLNKFGCKMYPADVTVVTKVPTSEGIHGHPAHCTFKGNSISCLSTNQLHLFVKRALGGSIGVQQNTIVQRFLKCNGRKPYVIRSRLRQTGQLPESQSWIISSKHSFEAPPSEMVSSTEKQAFLSRHFLATLNHEVAPISCKVFPCAKMVAEPTLESLLGIRVYLQRVIGRKMDEIVGDFLKDTHGTWWLLQIKGFRMAQLRLSRTPKRRREIDKRTERNRTNEYGKERETRVAISRREREKEIEKGGFDYTEFTPLRRIRNAFTHGVEDEESERDLIKHRAKNKAKLGGPTKGKRGDQQKDQRGLSSSFLNTSPSSPPSGSMSNFFSRDMNVNNGHNRRNGSRDRRIIPQTERLRRCKFTQAGFASKELACACFNPWFCSLPFSSFLPFSPFLIHSLTHSLYSLNSFYSFYLLTLFNSLYFDLLHSNSLRANSLFATHFMQTHSFQLTHLTSFDSPNSPNSFTHSLTRILSLLMYPRYNDRTNDHRIERPSLSPSHQPTFPLVIHRQTPNHRCNLHESTTPCVPRGL